MPKSIEREILDDLDLQQGSKESRDKFLDLVAEKSFDRYTPDEENDSKATIKEKDAAWDALSEAAQEWVAAAQKAFNDQKKVKDFPDAKPAADDKEERGGRTARTTRRGDDDDADKDDRRSRRDDDEKDDRRSSRDDDKDDRRSRRDDDDADKDDRRSRRDDDDKDDRRSRRDDDDKDDRRSRRDDDADKDKEKDDDDRGGRGSRTSRSRDDDKADKDDKGGDKDTLPSQLKTKIRDALLENPAATADQILKSLNTRTTVSKTLISDMKTEWRATVKHLQDNKQLKKAIL